MKTTLRKRAEKENASKQKKIDQLNEFVAKFSAGTRASQVQSRKKEINRLQVQDLKESNILRPYIRFKVSDDQPGKMLIKASKISHQYGNSKSLFAPVSFNIYKGDKIGVIGNNGVGKTTLLKLLSGEIVPSLGTVEHGHKLHIESFPQLHSDLVDKTTEEDILSWLYGHTECQLESEIRSILGQMLFPGHDIRKLVKTLSGGETARLILSKIILSNHNCLIVDEPNNHLDLESVSALSQSLHDYPGSVILAAHDRELLHRVANRLIIISDHQVEIYEGTLEEYLFRKK